MKAPVPEPCLKVFTERAAHWGRAMGVRHGRVRVKDHRSLWGSCTAKGDLNFNWRLSLAPPETLDYVVVHELAHLFERNHSRRFWDRVSRWCPDYRAHRRWLRANGPELLRKPVPRPEGAGAPRVQKNGPDIRPGSASESVPAGSNGPRISDTPDLR